MSDWKETQEHEAEYWRDCLGMVAWGEFCKQNMYGREMQLWNDHGDGMGELDMAGKRVLDVGGGPVSMTLRCYNHGGLVVVDPLEWPRSAMRRYENYGIEFQRAPGEDLDQLDIGEFDEVWIYNVLQHVSDPAKILANAVDRVTPRGLLRIFEWLWIPADKCHPWVLTPELILSNLTGLRQLHIGIPRLKEWWSDASALAAVLQK